MTAVDRSRPPLGGSPEPFRFPAVEHVGIAPGVDGFLARSERGPLVTLEVVLPAGGDRDPVDAAGLASLTADLLDEGTERFSGPELAARVEGLGGSLSTSCDWDATYVAISSLARHWEQALELAVEVARRPTFPEAEVERLRRRRLTEILRRRSQPSALADEALVAALYGAGPYGHPLVGTEADLRALDPGAPARFYTERLRGPAKVVAVGDLDLERFRRRGDELFAGWPQEAVSARTEIAPAEREGVEVVVVDRPAAAQTELRVAHAGPPYDHPDRIALAALNTLFGGKFTSRINLNLRERHGFTYGASSRFGSRLGPGPFTVSAAVANESAGAAAREVLHELARLRDEPVRADELADTVDYLVGVFPYTLQTVDGLAQRLTQLAVYGLPDDWFDRLLRELPRLAPADLLAAARTHLHPDRAVVVAVGPAETIVPGLEALGPVRLVGSSASPA